MKFNNFVLIYFGERKILIQNVCEWLSVKLWLIDNILSFEIDLDIILLHIFTS